MVKLNANKLDAEQLADAVLKHAKANGFDAAIMQARPKFVSVSVIFPQADAANGKMIPVMFFYADLDSLSAESLFVGLGKAGRPNPDVTTRIYNGAKLREHTLRVSRLVGCTDDVANTMIRFIDTLVG